MEKKDIKFFDENIIRRGDITDRKIHFFKGTNIPMPSLFEISNSGMCNRKCAFCPRSDPNYNHVNQFISQELHDKIYHELSENEFSGSVIFSGFAEPLLDKRIYKQIQDIRNKLPNSNIELITNGDPLNHERIEKLFDAGLSYLLVSAYDSEEQAIMFRNMLAKTKVDPSKYIVRNRYYGEEKDFGITISNRGGNMNNTVYKIEATKEPLKAKCTYPAYTFFIDYNGDVLTCSHDWGKEMIMGNLNKNNIFEIWTGKKFSFARKQLLNANRNFSPCDVCNVRGGLIGNKHGDYWTEKLNQKKEV
ncbi:SPASM domain-containing protein [Candidatus Pelagibacter sp.]|nr:SPASM domain-containing protein [Candidatus Pelagibacter sp.]